MYFCKTPHSLADLLSEDSTVTTVMHTIAQAVSLTEIINEEVMETYKLLSSAEGKEGSNHVFICCTVIFKT